MKNLVLKQGAKLASGIFGLVDQQTQDVLKSSIFGSVRNKAAFRKLRTLNENG